LDVIAIEAAHAAHFADKEQFNRIRAKHRRKAACSGRLRGNGMSRVRFSCDAHMNCSRSTGVNLFKRKVTSIRREGCGSRILYKERRFWDVGRIAHLQLIYT